MRPTRILAVTVSAVVGLLGGVVSAVLLDRSEPIEDPLGLGVPMVNQSCTGSALLMVDFGESTSGLSAAVADDPDTRYLETANSCDTAWRRAGEPTPTYVDYLGPFTRSEACVQRMSAEHRGNLVTVLTSGTPDVVQCLCYVAYRTMPELRPGQTPSVLEGMYARSLQEMLTKMGRRGVKATGVYDARTVAEVRKLQADYGLAVTGVMNQATWNTLQNKGCDFY